MTDQMTTTKVRRLSDAQLNRCRECGHMERPQLWGLSQQRWMHENGTGHKVDYVAISAK